tara:strand:+ start:346 stop:540 length:195 start_codon:yes stop_codon:yes gene_type:complete
MPSEAYKNALMKLNLEESYRNKAKKPSNKLTHDFFKNTTKTKAKKPDKKGSPKKKCYSLCDYLF